MRNDGLNCKAVTWAVAALAGVVAAVMLMVLGGWTFMQGAFVGLLLFLAGGALLAWAMCGALPRPGTAGSVRTVPPQEGQAHRVAGSAPATAPATAAAAAPAAAAAAAPAPAPAAAAATAGSGSAASRAAAKPKAAKPARAPAPAAAKAPAPAAAPAPAPAPAPEPAAPSPAASAATARPDALAAARDGVPDDLKMIKGVGPKLEIMLHGMGIFHFDQIAGWTARELAWVDENLEGFKGRASRDNWIAQAKTLAAGGETAFSKRVGEGEVY